MQPQVLVEQSSRSPAPLAGQWSVVWRVQNQGLHPLEIFAARLPHSQFRCAEKELIPTPKLLPNESSRLELQVACNEPPGSEVKNAFLILRVLWLESRWRVLARLRVVFDEEGGPQAMTELVTTQRVGFSVLKGKG